jgi:heat shock protein HslJ
MVVRSLGMTLAGAVRKEIEMRTLLMAALLLAACHSSADDVGAGGPVPVPAPAAESAGTTAWHTPVTYTGNLPCADCPGIRLVVTLFADGSYRLSRVYQERSGAYYEVGNWVLAGDSTGVVLRPAGGGQPSQFRIVAPDTLQALGAGGAPLPPQLPSTLTRMQTVDSLLAARAASGRSPSPLAGTSWQLSKLPGRPRIAPGDPPTMEFDSAAHRVSGNGGCNRFGGPYQTSGDSLRFGALISTKRACLSDERTAQETALLAALGRTTRFAITGDTLRLLADGQAAAEFVAATAQ